jgi:hypothetical protein
MMSNSCVCGGMAALIVVEQRTAASNACSPCPPSIFDTFRRRIVLFGNSDHATANDTWGWDGRAWTLLAAHGPPRRGVHAMTFDIRRGVAVLFGGYGSGNTFLNDTWEWDGRTWTRIHTAVSPSPRFDTFMTYDAARNRTVLFGGRGESGNLADTWEYDGRTWTPLTVAGPSPRNGHVMVHDVARRTVLLFGGRNEASYYKDLWSFDGEWRRLH